MCGMGGEAEARLGRRGANLDGSGEEMAVMRFPRGEGGAIVEGEFLLAIGELHRRLEGVDGGPHGSDLFLHLWEAKACRQRLGKGAHSHPQQEQNGAAELPRETWTGWRCKGCDVRSLPAFSSAVPAVGSVASAASAAGASAVFGLLALPPALLPLALASRCCPSGGGAGASLAPLLALAPFPGLPPGTSWPVSSLYLAFNARSPSTAAVTSSAGAWRALLSRTASPCAAMRASSSSAALHTPKRPRLTIT